MHLVLKICPNVCFYAYLDLTQNPSYNYQSLLSLSPESDDDLLLMNPSPPGVCGLCSFIRSDDNFYIVFPIEDVAVVIM